MSKTFSAAYSSVTLSAADNPVYITATGSITGTAVAMYGDVSTAWTIDNAGMVIGGTVVSGAGVLLENGGLITNQSGGTITGDYAIRVRNAAGTVTNAGSIGGAGTGAPKGILLEQGGTVTNQSSGLITGYNVINIGSVAGTLLNAGSIGSAYPNGIGVQFSAGGYVSNSSTGTISAGGQAVYIIDGVGTLVNDGTILSTGNVADVQMQQGGTVDNQANGLISGGQFAVQFFQYGSDNTVINAGSIVASGYRAIDLKGGYVTNKVGAYIGGSSVGVYSTGMPGTVLNSGTINSPIDVAVKMHAGGTVSNAAGGVISGLFVGVAMTGTDTVTNAGLISGNGNYGVEIGSGLVTNLATGSITGGNNGLRLGSGATGDNAGYIYGSSDAVNLYSTAVLTNQSTGTIVGGNGVYLGGGKLINAGSITGGAFYAGVLSGGGNGGEVTNQSGGVIRGDYQAIKLTGFGTVVNAGSLAATSAVTAAVAIYLQSGGEVTNQAGGVISGSLGVEVANNSATIVNDGTIGASYGGAVLMFYGGVIDNHAGGVIATSGTNNAVLIQHGGTVINSGTITADPSRAAIYFGGGFTNRLVMDPGAVFTGYVNGGNLAGNSYQSTIELRSGASTGTLSGLGSKYVRFQNITIDNDATWSLDGYFDNTIINAGSLDTPLTVGVGAYLSNQATGVISGAPTAAKGAVIAIDARVANAGLIANTATTGAANGVYLHGAPVLTNVAGGTIQGGNGVYAYFASTPSISNAGTITGTADNGYGIVLMGNGSVSNLRVIEATGTNSTGVRLQSGGPLSNASTGIITGTAYGVVVTGGGSTIADAGSIGGASAAVKFATGSTNLLVLYPGATFSGLVDGGNSVGSSPISTLQLAPGSGLGTVTGLGVQIANFAKVTVDDTATWALTSNSIGAGYTLIDSGTLLNYGTIGSTMTVATGGLFINAAAGTVGVAAGDAVYGGPGASVANAGSLGGSSFAVHLAAGGANRVLIAPGAAFTGTVQGGNTLGAPFVSTLELASASGTGTLAGYGTKYVNFANITIDAGATWTIGGAFDNTVINAGSLDAPLYMQPGGVLTNQATGVISGAPTAADGAVVANNAKVINAGQIGNTGSAGYASGVYLQGTASLSNAVTGTITGVDGVVAYASPTMSITNAGAIIGTGSNGYGILLRGNGTIVNTGQITASSTTGGFGVKFASSGLLTNAVGGTIDGFVAVVGVAAATTIDNAGLITSASYAGVELIGSGFVTNHAGGVIDATTGMLLINAATTVKNAGIISGTIGLGINLFHGGYLLNQSGGTIRGFAGIDAFAGTATIVNAGSIIGLGIASQYGISFGAGGIVTNLAGGEISGYVGVTISQGGTVVNAGSIIGTGTTAVGFASGNTNLLKVLPGGSFTGLVDGGNTIGGTSISTLELASGASEGTLSGLGTQFVNFANVTVDSGAYWTISSNIIAGETLTNSGTLAGKVFVGGNAIVTNTAGGLITSATGNAIYAPSAVLPVTITNAGHIIQSGTNTAINLHGGGIVSNAASGTIVVNTVNAIDIQGGPGTAVNDGLISATTTDSGGIVLRTGGLASNSSTGTISADFGIYLSGGGAVVNDGSVTGAYTGIALSAGGSVTNTTGGIVSGNFEAILANNVVGTIVNDGRVLDATGSGVVLNAGGSVTNQANGTISALNAGVQINGAFGTVVNQGSIHGNNSNGVGVFQGGTVSNAAGGEITGYGGVQIANGGGTLINAGSIGGSGNYAVRLAAGYTNLLTVDPGASFTGKVDGGNVVGGAFVSTLELASGASAGTLSGLGTQLVNFAQTTIDSGAAWTLTGTNTLAAGTTLTNFGTLELTNATLTDSGVLQNDGGIILDPSTLTVADLIGTGSVTIVSGSTLDVQGTLASGETISLGGNGAYLHFEDPVHAAGSVTNFGFHETIVLEGIDFSTVSYSSGHLYFGSGDSFPLSLTNPGSTIVVATDSGGDTNLVVACYLRGTRILTPAGEIPVETLAIGDAVSTFSGEVKRIKWIGQRAYAGRFIAGNRKAQPILIRAGALDDNVPGRDLYVSPRHAMFIDGVLVPAEMLVNGASILRCDMTDTVEYFHIELDAHDVILAEGAPSESFVDCDNRMMFHNGAEFARLYPHDTTPRWAFCAPVVEDGDALDLIRLRLEQRLAGFDETTTFDPDLRLMADGCVVAPESVHGSTYRFRLPAPPAELRILSRSSVPADVDASADQRRLGVSLVRLVLDGEALSRIVDAHDASLLDGFHEAEQTHRWTDGDARVPAQHLAGFDGTLTVDVELLDHSLRYHGRNDATLLTSDDVYLLVDDAYVRGTQLANGAFVFRLAERPGAVRVIAGANVALRRVTVDNGEQPRTIEASKGSALRWQDGDMLLPAFLFEGVDGRCELRVVAHANHSSPAVRERSARSAG